MSPRAVNQAWTFSSVQGRHCLQERPARFHSFATAPGTQLSPAVCCHCLTLSSSQHCRIFTASSKLSPKTSHGSPMDRWRRSISTNVTREQPQHGYCDSPSAISNRRRHCCLSCTRRTWLCWRARWRNRQDILTAEDADSAKSVMKQTPILHSPLRPFVFFAVKKYLQRIVIACAILQLNEGCNNNPPGVYEGNVVHANKFIDAFYSFNRDSLE